MSPRPIRTPLSPGMRLLAWAVAAAVWAAAAGACIDAPWWRFDRYAVDGEFRGRSCRARLSRSAPDDTVPLTRGNRAVSLASTGGDNVLYGGRRVSVHTVTLACGPVAFDFLEGVTTLEGASVATPGARRAARVPVPGRYAVAGGGEPYDRAFNRDTVRALVVPAPVDVGRWPLALGGATLDAGSGWLQLDTLTWDTARGPISVSGRFHFVARRRAAP